MERFIDTQEWVPVHTLPGFEACIEYYVNRKGEVKSTKYAKERLLKHRSHKLGYPMVALTQRIGKGKTLYVCVHKLVAFAFLGPPPTPYGSTKGCSIIDHIDEDKSNCHINNLRWIKRPDNNVKYPRQKQKLSTLKNNAEASNGRLHSAELGKDQSSDGAER